MENDSAWIWEEVKLFQKNTGNVVLFPSDWDTELGNISYPNEIIKNAISNSFENTNLYLYSEDQHFLKELILNRLKDHDLSEFSIEQITLFNNSTSSLYLAFAALNKVNVKRFLVVTPVYYSIIDTLKDINATQIFYHLTDENHFTFDLNELTEVLRKQYIDAIILTDPVYSTGIEILFSQYKAILGLCRNQGIWVIIDNTLGGMPWNYCPAFFDKEKLKLIGQCEKFIFIDSLTKRLQINSIKHSLVIASRQIVSIMEDLSCQITGGFCISQFELIKELYNANNEIALLDILRENIDRIKKNHSLLQTSLIDTDFDIYPSNNGYFSIIHHRSLAMSDVNIKDIVKRFIYGQQIRIIPLSSLSFYDDAKFGFRVNLLKEIRPMIPLLLKGIRENIHRF